MNLLRFLKPNGAKILLFILLIIIAPFPYFIRSETSGQYEVKWLWGFPPFVSLVYNYLPVSVKELDIGIFEISKINTTFYWMPIYAFSIFLLSCVVNLIIEHIKLRFDIATFRGVLWRKLEKREMPPLTIQRPEKIGKKEEVKLEEDIGEIDGKKVKEMVDLIKEEEAFIKEQKKNLNKYLDEANIKKLKDIGVDVRENQILCSRCNQWVKLPKDRLIKLIEKYGFDIIWEYKCPECKNKK